MAEAVGAALEAAADQLLAAFGEGNETEARAKIPGGEIVAVKLGADPGSNESTVAKVDNVEVALPASFLSALFDLPGGGGDGGGGGGGAVALVVAAFDSSTASAIGGSSPSPAVPSSAEEDSGDGGGKVVTEVKALVSIEIQGPNGKISVSGLAEPIALALPVNVTPGLFCAFWDEKVSDWSTEGVDTSIVEGKVECLTTHLSLFGAIVRGFVGTWECSQLTLLNFYAMGLLFQGDWYRGDGAVSVWITLAVLGVLFAASAREDEKHVWRNDFFLAERRTITVPEEEEMVAVLSTTRTEEVKKGILTVLACGVVGSCTALCVWFRESSAIRDVIDEIFSTWLECFSDIREMCEELVGNLLLQGGDTGAGEVSHWHALNLKITSHLLLGSLRRLAGASLGISNELVIFVMEDEALGDFLTEEHHERLAASEHSRGLQSSMRTVAERRAEIVRRGGPAQYKPGQPVTYHGGAGTGSTSASSALQPSPRDLEADRPEAPAARAEPEAKEDAESPAAPAGGRRKVSFRDGPEDVQGLSEAESGSEGDAPDRQDNAAPAGEAPEAGFAPLRSTRSSGSFFGGHLPHLDLHMPHLDMAHMAHMAHLDDVAAHMHMPHLRGSLHGLNHDLLPAFGPQASEGPLRNALHWKKTVNKREAWVILHHEISERLHHAGSLYSKRCGLWRQVLRVFIVQNPLTAVMFFNPLMTSKLRTLFVAMDILGSLVLTCLFFSASGDVKGVSQEGKLCGKADPLSSSTFFQIGRLLAVASASVIVAGVPVSILGTLHHRSFRLMDYEGSFKWNRQLRVWQLEDRIIWSVGGSYCIFSIFYVLTFLANIDDADQRKFTRALVIAVNQIVILVPLAVATIIPGLAWLCLYVNHRFGVFERDYIMRHTHRRVHAESNIMLPIVYI